MKKLLTIMIVLLFAVPCYSGNYEIAFHMVTKNHEAIGSNKTELGAIAAIRPSPASWSEREQLKYLIVKFTNMDDLKAMAYSDPYYGDDDLTKHPKYADGVELRKTRKWKLQINQLKSKIYNDLDTSLIANEEVRYQPFLDLGLSIDDKHPETKNILKGYKPK